MLQIHGRGTHIIFFFQSKELPNFRRPLRPQPLRLHLVRQAGDLTLSLFHDSNRQNRQVHPHNAAPNRFPLALAGPAGTVAAVALRQQQTNTGRVHDALLHGETLLVITARDAESVAFELVADAVARDFLAHAPVHEDSELAVVFDLDELLGPVCRIRDVELHLGRCQQLSD